MGLIKSKEYEIYKKHNRSTWFCLPLLGESKKTYRDFSFGERLKGTYLRGFKYDCTLERPLYLVYNFEDSEKFKSMEEYLMLDLCENQFIDLIDIDEKSICIVYNITNTTPYPDNSKKEPHDSWVSDYDKVLEGKYYWLSTRHKLKVLDFFYDRQCSYDNFLKLLFGRSQILWEMRRKNLGCRYGDSCKCNIQTKLEESVGDNGEKRMVPRAMKNQLYLDCKDYEKWEMPVNIELESQPDLILETYNFKEKENEDSSQVEIMHSK